LPPEVAAPGAQRAASGAVLPIFPVFPFWRCFFCAAAAACLRKWFHSAAGHGVAVDFVLDLRWYGAEKKQNSLKKDLHFAEDMVI